MATARLMEREQPMQQAWLYVKELNPVLLLIRQAGPSSEGRRTTASSMFSLRCLLLRAASLPKIKHHSGNPLRAESLQTACLKQLWCRLDLQQAPQKTNKVTCLALMSVAEFLIGTGPHIRGPMPTSDTPQRLTQLQNISLQHLAKCLC